MRRRRLEVAALWVGTVIALGAGWTGIVTRIGIDRVDSGQAVFVSLCALAAPALATAITARHPDEPTGPLVGLAVLATMLAACRTTDLGPVAPVAGVTALVLAPLPALVVSRYSVLTFPPGTVRLVSRCFWASAVLGVLLGVALVLGGSVPTALWFTTAPGAVEALATVLLVVHATLVCTGPLVLASTSVIRRMPRASRVAARPIMWPVACWVLALTVSEVWEVAGAVGSPTRDLSQGLDATLFVILPAFLVGAAAAGIGWIDLTVRIPTSPSGTPVPRASIVDVEQYLSRALADPSIRVRYPVDGAQIWVSSAGSSTSPETGGVDRATTVIVRGSRLIGLIDQDAAVTAHPDAVELVATGAGLIMETERLRASAASDLEQARLLAERLLVASDEPRSALRATLVKGPLAELDAVAEALAGGTPVADVVSRLTTVAADVRAISHGILSASLATGGLRASLSGHLVPDRRYAPVIEMTTYLAAQADPAATVEEMMGEDGPLLLIRTGPAPTADVRDRVAALGGTVSHQDGGWIVGLPHGRRAGPLMTTTTLMAWTRAAPGPTPAIRARVEEHGGRFPHREGLALFTGTADAVATAVEWQQVEQDQAATSLALHVAEVTYRADTPEPAAVGLVRGLAERGHPGDILATEVVRMLLPSPAPAHWSDELATSIGEPAQLVHALVWPRNTDTAPITVAVAEDVALIRAGLVSLLRDDGFAVVGEAGDYDSVLTLVRATRPRLLITDVRMPPGQDDEGLRAASLLRTEQPGLAVLVLSQSVRASAAANLLTEQTSGLGYLLKERVTALDEFLDAARAVAAGRTVIDPLITDELLGRHRNRDQLAALADRERSVLELMAQGLSNSAIAERLTLSGRTVESHVRAIMTKLDLWEDPAGNRRVQAVIRWLDQS